MSWPPELMQIGALRLDWHLPSDYMSCGGIGLTERSELHADPVAFIVCDIGGMSFSALIFRSQRAVIA